ncbi:hypothetical protein LTR86_011229 [Recurvomyces mirabilis]|nr:hypothetical protein LTR86_011229 [Recurvomyces mirabilis]
MKSSLRELWNAYQDRARSSYLAGGPQVSDHVAQARDESTHSQLRHVAGPGFQFMSDLPLEQQKELYTTFAIPPRGRYLILAGDVGRFGEVDEYSAFLQRQCDIFQQVLLVPGNHEFYGTTRENGLNIAYEMERKFEGRLVVMNRTRHTRSTTRDFVRIRNWTISDHNEEHEKDLAFLKNELERIARTQPECRVIIATHYAPSFSHTTHPKHTGNELSKCFCSEALSALSGWKGSDQVSHWIFGHTHYNNCFYAKKTIVLSNQSRCFDSNQPFDVEATI